jgi:hypothetical protein
VGAALSATAAGSGEFGLEGTERVLVDQVHDSRTRGDLGGDTSGGVRSSGTPGATANAARVRCSEAAPTRAPSELRANKQKTTGDR